jgi:hypothetical protein
MLQVLLIIWHILHMPMDILNILNMPKDSQNICNELKSTVVCCDTKNTKTKPQEYEQ